MNKTNGRSDQPISTRSKNEVAETLDTPKSVTTRYGVHSENNDTFGASSNDCKDSISTVFWNKKPNISDNRESRTRIRGEVLKNDDKWNAYLSETETFVH